MRLRFRSTCLLFLLIISMATMDSGMVGSLSMVTIAPIAAMLIQMVVSALVSI